MLGRLRRRVSSLMSDPTPHLLRELSVLVLRAPGAVGGFKTGMATILLEAAWSRA